jgi:hypothetical protein
MYAKCQSQYNVPLFNFWNAKQPYTTVKGIVTIPTEVHDEMLLILVFPDWYIIYTESVT